ncbi:delta-class carbonic anhydrase [Nisaea sediminum]|uniref:delta-class carbonic anhydrase n=1 Tax=Nisaea sediminum TaxID=2775867 RepID=UPI001865F3E0|nr:delta-class carbonic anhydrase [Nisaea sediminum]
MKTVAAHLGAAALFAAVILIGNPLAAAPCSEAGPQTPRDITLRDGTNPRTFSLAPAATKMNLCDIHTHTNAEHKGPGYTVFAGSGTYGGYQCNESSSLTAAELAAPTGDTSSFAKVKPGDTIEVHWVHTTCDAVPAHGLGSCLPADCKNPQLRVEAQVFLVVNDPNALDFTSFDYHGKAVGGLHQAKAIPGDTGTPVVFRGSTTGPSYNQETCSPLEVTWSVRPNCAKVDINSIFRWAKNDKFFRETASHGVRQLVTKPELLSKID